MAELENMLLNQKLTHKLINEAGEFAAGLMIKQSGYRWSTPYKEPVLTGLIKRALFESWQGEKG
jgi:hypothetical protein